MVSFFGLLGSVSFSFCSFVELASVVLKILTILLDVASFLDILLLLHLVQCFLQQVDSCNFIGLFRTMADIERNVSTDF